MKLVIGHFYPELLNLYGDRGNILTLMKRCQWRGIETEIREYTLEEEADFSEIDIAFIGGGSDREQLLVCRRLLEMKEAVKEYIEDQGVLLAICGGYQLLGKDYQLQGETIPGLSVLDLNTVQGNGRLISNVVIDTPFGTTVGFENHGGRTYLNGHTPFGKVLYGNGNNGEDGGEGVLYKNVLGTYLHGPLLPKNPHIADEVIKRALIRKTGEEVILEPLNDEEEAKARDYIIRTYAPK